MLVFSYSKTLTELAVRKSYEALERISDARISSDLLHVKRANGGLDLDDLETVMTEGMALMKRAKGRPIYCVEFSDDRFFFIGSIASVKKKLNQLPDIVD